MHVERERELEQLLPLVPVDGEAEVDPARVRGERDGLDERRVAEPALTRRPPPSVTSTDTASTRSAPALVRPVDVPGVPAVRDVAVQLEQPGGPPLGQDLAVRPPGRGRRASSPSPSTPDPYEVVLEHEPVAVRPRLDRGGRRRARR